MKYLWLLLGVMLLSGCGREGALYLPGDAPEVQKLKWPIDHKK